MMKVEWIPVLDRLPKSDEPFLVIDKWGYMSVCGYSPGYGWYPKLDGTYPNFYSEGITHYTELPDPPKQNIS